MVDEKWIRTAADRLAAEQGYRFLEDEARKAIDFIEHELTLGGDSLGKLYKLPEWAVDYLMRLYGWTHPTKNKRRFRFSYVEIPKKNSKTTLMAALSVYAMVENPGAVVVQAARDLKQGLEIHRESRRFIRANPVLDEYFKINENLNFIKFPANDDAILHLLSKDPKSADGKNPTFVVMDELHRFDKPTMFDVLKENGKARKNFLMVTITTAGDDRNSIAWKMHEKAVDILNGDTSDLAFLPLVFAAEEGEDLDNPEVWRRCNPGLGTIIDEEDFANDLKQAKRIPSSWAYFKRTAFNIWTFDDSKWLNIKDWDDVAGDVPLEGFIGRETYLAIDLSSVRDLTAGALVTKGDDGTIFLRSMYWMPKQTARERADTDQVPYPSWIDAGHMIGTDTRTTDFEAVEVEILRLRAMGINIVQIGFDDWNARPLRQKLERERFNVMAISQSISSYTGPTKEMERRVLDQTITHCGSPVTRYCVSNVIVEQDALENIRPSKNKSQKGRIDGVVAAIMALGMATTAKSHASGCDFG